MRAITLDEAVKVINETFAEAKRRNAYPLTAVLLDAGGRMKAALKQDGASLLRFEVSYGKAYAALAMGRESRQVLQKAKDKPLFMQSFMELADGPMFLEGGGQLIRDKDGEVIGAIATTGDTNEVDDLCAIAGIRAAGFKTDHDFSEADMRRLNIKRGPPIEDPEKAKARRATQARLAASRGMPMPRPQDVLFAVLGVALVAMLAFDLGVVVLALVGAFACGSIYVFAGMMPSRDEELLEPGFHVCFSVDRIVVAGLDLARHVRRPNAPPGRSDDGSSLPACFP